MMKFFYHTMGLDDLRVNFIRPEGYAEGDADLTPRYKDVMGVLLKAIILNEQHFKVFTFGSIPYRHAARSAKQPRAAPPVWANIGTSAPRARSDRTGVTSLFRDKPDPNSWVQGQKNHSPVRRN